jgi:type IV pilus assembly protein PilV
MNIDYKQPRHKGMTIIEMLVALVILSLGMLGMAALQVRGQQYNTAAHVRTQATILAGELIEQMRVNPDPNGDGILDDYAMTIPTAAPTPNCDTATCTPTELRDFDLYRWQQRINEIFPGGRGIVMYNTNAAGTHYTATPAQNRNRYQISIEWELTDAEKDDPTAESVTKTMTWVVTP